MPMDYFQFMEQALAQASGEPVPVAYEIGDFTLEDATGISVEEGILNDEEYALWMRNSD